MILQHLEETVPNGATLDHSGLEVVCIQLSIVTKHLNMCRVGLAVLSAIITFYFIVPLTNDGMEKEDAEVGRLVVILVSLLVTSSLFTVTVPCLSRKAWLRYFPNGSDRRRSLDNG
jgi:hypothetical protein